MILETAAYWLQVFLVALYISTSLLVTIEVFKQFTLGLGLLLCPFIVVFSWSWPVFTAILYCHHVYRRWTRGKRQAAVVKYLTMTENEFENLMQSLSESDLSDPEKPEIPGGNSDETEGKK